MQFQTLTPDNTMGNISSNLLHIISSLSSLKNSEEVVRLFIESIQTIFPGYTLGWHSPDEPAKNGWMPVYTPNKTYGFIETFAPGPIGPEKQSLLQDTFRLIAVSLERIEQETLLNNQKAHLQQLVENKIADLQKKQDKLNEMNEEFASLNEELIETNKTLLKANKKLQEEIRERKKVEKKFYDSDKFFNHSVDMLCIAGFDGFFKVINPAWEQTLGWGKEEMLSKPWNDFVHPDDIDKTNQVKSTIIGGEVAYQFENRYRCKDGSYKWLSWNSFPSPDGNIMFGVARDITNVKEAERNLRRIEWMLSPKREKEKEPITNPEMPTYGNLTELNSNELIFHSIDQEILTDIANDYLELLETSSAIYEKNGDYALGIFSSGWCRFMDEASRKLCRTESNRQALGCGKWLCHESCWTKASLKAIETGMETEISCNGGLKLYAQPIFANKQVIGAINFGYGDPPTDRGELEKLADKYEVDVAALIKLAKEYESRPPFIIELAKKRLQSSARMIGTLVERKLAQDALEKSETQSREATMLLEGIFNAIPDIIGVQDTHHKMLLYNEAGYKFLNLKKGEEIGKHCYELIGRIIPCEECATTIALRTKKPAQIEKYVPEFGIWLEARSYPVFNEKGQIVYIIEHLRDITKKIEFEIELTKAKEKAEESDRLKTNFLSNMSHEIRTPMNSIMGFASLLPEEDSKKLICQYAKIIVQNSEQLVSIIDEIVLYSILQTDLFAYKPSRFLAYQLMVDIQQSFNLPEFQKYGVTMQYECMIGKDTFLETDREKLKQIIVNLITNAIKYTHRGSITLGCEKYENFYHFYVKDTGIGIPEKDLPHVFERFFRGSNVNEITIRGTGLGLSIVKELAEKLGGSVNVESEVGKGSTFYLLLPVKFEPTRLS